MGLFSSSNSCFFSVFECKKDVETDLSDDDTSDELALSLTLNLYNTAN